jgi:FixJ family two-component response regulator
VRTLSSNHPGVITLDLSMPQTNDLEVLDLLREMNFCGKLIIVSGHRECLRANVIKWARAYSFDVLGNLEKPISVRALGDILTQAPLISAQST